MPITDTHPNCVCTRDLYRFELPDGSTISDITANSDIRELDPRQEPVQVGFQIANTRQTRIEKRERENERRRLEREAQKQRRQEGIDPFPFS